MDTDIELLKDCLYFLRWCLNLQGIQVYFNMNPQCVVVSHLLSKTPHAGQCKTGKINWVNSVIFLSVYVYTSAVSVTHVWYIAPLYLSVMHSPMKELLSVSLTTFSILQYVIGHDTLTHFLNAFFSEHWLDLFPLNLSETANI